MADALGRFGSVERMKQPEDIKRKLLWLRERQDAETGYTVLYANAGSGRCGWRR